MTYATSSSKQAKISKELLKLWFVYTLWTELMVIMGWKTCRWRQVHNGVHYELEHQYQTSVHYDILLFLGPKMNANPFMIHSFINEGYPSLRNFNLLWGNLTWTLILTMHCISHSEPKNFYLSSPTLLTLKPKSMKL